MIPGEIIPGGRRYRPERRPPDNYRHCQEHRRPPVQVGSHFHFAEVNPTLDFDRSKARGQRLDIPAGTAVRFEPGQARDVELVPFAGDGVVIGFNAHVDGKLEG